MNINRRGAVGGIMLIALGSVVFVVYAQQWWMGFSSLYWQKALGTVIASNVVSCSRKYQSPDYRTEITYRYLVEGVAYSSKNVSFTNDGVSTGCGHARELAGQYPIGKNMVVYYDPKNPKSAVLLPGGTNYVSIGLSLFLIFLGLLSCTIKNVGWWHSGITKK